MSSPQCDCIPRGLYCSPDCWGLGLGVFDVNEVPLFEGGANYNSQRGISPLLVVVFRFRRKYMFLLSGEEEIMRWTIRAVMPCHVTLTDSQPQPR